MTIIEKLAREAAPCICNYWMKCEDEACRRDSKCANVRLRPAIEAALRKVVEECALIANVDDVWESAKSIRALLTDEVGVG